MPRAKRCSVRGCKKPRSGRYLRCAEHRREWRNAQNLERWGGDRRLGATCLICGRGPYVKVGSHTFMRHGVTSAEYQRMFPGADMTHPDLKPIFAEDAKRNGARRRRQRRCKRGHLLRAPNLKIVNNGRRTCRECVREANGRSRQRLEEASGTKLCECGCGTEIPRLSGNGRPRRYAYGHRKGRQPRALGVPGHIRGYRLRREAAGTKPCECGCGTEIPALTVDLLPARFVKGHHRRVRRAA